MKKYKEKFNIFKSIIDKKDPVIVEIGAHFGEDSVRFGSAFPEATIYCFEPDPRCIKIFRRDVKNDRIKLFEVALSAEDGEAEFYQSYDESKSNFVPEKYDWIDLDDYIENKLSNSGSSSLRPGYSKNFNKITVKTQRFDKWYRENDISGIDLVWIDVQGAEKSVLEGMGEKIKNIGLIWTEYGEHTYDGALSRNETIEYLYNKSFKVVEHCSSKTDSGDLMFYNSQMYII